MADCEKKKKKKFRIATKPFYIYILCLLFWDVRRQPNLPQSCTAAPPPHLDCTTSNPFRTQHCFKAALPMCILDSNSYFSHLNIFYFNLFSFLQNRYVDAPMDLSWASKGKATGVLQWNSTSLSTTYSAATLPPHSFFPRTCSVCKNPHSFLC